MGLLEDICVICKLFLYAIYSTIETLTKNLIIPKKYLQKSIRNQLVLITGAAGGIGRELVANLLQHGAKVVCVDWNSKSLHSLEERLRAEMSDVYKHVFFFNIDVTDTHQVQRLYDDVQRNIGTVDILINSAGVTNNGKLFMELKSQDIHDLFQINLFSYMHTCRQFLTSMIQRNSGHIVNMCSSLGQFGAYGVTDYSASKFAVAGFTESLRIEMKSMRANIKVTLICPYHVDTNLFKDFSMDSFRWASVSNNDPIEVAKSITQGILEEKELIGYPKIQFYVFLAIKNLLTTNSTDRMMVWFGFNKAISKTRRAFFNE